MNKKKIDPIEAQILALLIAMVVVSYGLLTGAFEVEPRVEQPDPHHWSCLCIFCLDERGQE